MAEVMVWWRAIDLLSHCHHTITSAVRLRSAQAVPEAKDHHDPYSRCERSVPYCSPTIHYDCSIHTYFSAKRLKRKVRKGFRKERKRRFTSRSFAASLCVLCV